MITRLSRHCTLCITVLLLTASFYQSQLQKTGRYLKSNQARVLVGFRIVHYILHGVLSKVVHKYHS